MATNNGIDITLSGQSGTGAIAGTVSPSFTTPTIGAASATSVTFSSTNGIIGTTTNNNAAAGSVGEFISVNTTGTSLTTNVAANVASAVLTAGDWDVWGSFQFNPSSTTTLITASLSTTSATMVNSGTGTFILATTSLTSGNKCLFPLGQIRVPASGSTTVYVVMNCTFASTATGDGFIAARRVR